MATGGTQPANLHIQVGNALSCLNPYAGMTEWPKVSVSKTDEGQPSAGSNPASGAINSLKEG